MAQVIAKVACAEDEAEWLAQAGRCTVRAMRRRARERQLAARESGDLNGLDEEASTAEQRASLTITVDREDAWLFECSRMIVRHVAGLTDEDTVEALLGEGTTSLLATVRPGDVTVLDEAPDDDAQRKWRAEPAHWRRGSSCRWPRPTRWTHGSSGPGSACPVGASLSWRHGMLAGFGHWRNDLGTLPRFPMQHVVPETYEPSSGALRLSFDRARAGAIPVEEVWPETSAKRPAFEAREEWLVGRFKLGARLGRGGIAEVFAATDMETGRRVAVKVLPPYGKHAAVTPERVEAEMTLGRKVEHTNLCHVLESGHTEDGSPFLVTEALAGETLGHCLRRRGKVSVDAALRLTLEAARGLGALHRAGIVHRDVKPDNLFLCDTKHHEASVKVIDLGFAALSGTASEDPLRVFGTLRYTAPEQAIGEPVDARADVYSLGVVLFRAITGELPFDACADREIILHHVHSPIPPPSWFTEGVSPDVDAVVAGAVNKHPENRYPSMADFCDDLDRAIHGVPVEGPPLVVVPDWFEPSTDLGKKVVRVLGASWMSRSGD